MLNQKGKLIIALDALTETEARNKIDNISSECAGYMDRVVWKFNDLLSDIGLRGLDEMLKGTEGGVMLDPKWHDIPNTDTHYIEKLGKYELSNRAEFVTMHASNGFTGLKAAVDKRNELGIKTKILAVTALTTLDDSETNRIFDETSKHSVLKLAKEALNAGVDGIVCSPMEAQLLRDVYRDYNFEIVTPGVRFEGGDKGDQKRVMTPQRAVEQGSSHIVMGRPILLSEDVKLVVSQFFNEVKGVGYATDEQRNEFERLLYTGNWEELLRYIGAFYNRPEGGKYCRLASGLLSNAYINIGATERNYLVVERAANELIMEIKNQGITADIVMGAQMGSIRISLVLAEKLGIEQSIYTEKDEYDISSKLTISHGNMYSSGPTYQNITEGNDMGLPSGEYLRKLPKEELKMELKRHDIDLTGKKVILSEDIVTAGTTLVKMIELVEKRGGEVVAITCVGNRYGENNFNGIPLIACYNPPAFELFYDDNTPVKKRGINPKLSEGSEISEKAKNDWDELVNSMRRR